MRDSLGDRMKKQYEAPELKRGRLVSQPWAVSPAPQFTKEREVISALVPRYDQAEKSPKI